MTLVKEQSVLTIAHMDDVISVQQACINSLPDDQDLIHEKAPDDFERILTSNHMEMIGIWEGGALIAQAVALFPDIQNPDADMLDMLLPGGNVEKVTTLAGVIVDPAHKGKRLMGRLIEAWQGMAVEKGRDHALAMITDRNIPSLAGFLSGGMSVIDVAEDPADGSTVYFAHGNLNGGGVCSSSFQDAISNPSKIITPRTSFEERKELFDLGFIGTSLKRGENGLHTDELIIQA